MEIALCVSIGIGWTASLSVCSSLIPVSGVSPVLLAIAGAFIDLSW